MFWVAGPALLPGLLIWSMDRKYPAASRASNLWRDPGDWEVGGRLQSLGRFRETLESYSWEAQMKIQCHTEKV